MDGRKINNVLIAPDSFKDCLLSVQVASLLARGIKEKQPGAEVTVFPVADGGEGTLSCITFHSEGKWVSLSVADPLYRVINSGYLLTDDDRTAVIELAGASGIGILSGDERDPLVTSTFGTGELIKDALERGVSKIVLTIGGSATVDGGTGIASALGFRFLDKNSNAIDRLSGGMLDKISQIDAGNMHPGLKETEIIVACDVQNRLNGMEGAARVYGPQKGADEKGVQLLENGLMNLSSLIYRETGYDADKNPGTGAAGGASLFLLAYGKAVLQSGFDTIAGYTGFYDAIDRADLIVTGEGCIDRQTSYGKVVFSIAEIAKKRNIPLVGVAGAVHGRDQVMKETGAAGLYSISDLAGSKAESINRAPEYLVEIGKLIAEDFL
jgi:glycerate 2-kinase